jgi:hyperosmotically inducible periplasmic protein
MKRILLSLLCATFVAACSTNAKSPDVADSIRKSLDQSGLKDVSVSQDRDKGVVTISGKVASEADKAQADSIAKGIAIGQVVADQIVVTPPGNESDAKDVSAALDSGIEQNLKAVFIDNKLDAAVKYQVKAGSVTLSGTVNSQAKRAQAATLASQVPNVKEVINELQIKNQKATGGRGRG